MRTFIFSYCLSSSNLASANLSNVFPTCPSVSSIMSLISSNSSLIANNSLLIPSNSSDNVAVSLFAESSCTSSSSFSLSNSSIVLVAKLVIDNTQIINILMNDNTYFLGEFKLRHIINPLLLVNQ